MVFKSYFKIESYIQQIRQDNIPHCLDYRLFRLS